MRVGPALEFGDRIRDLAAHRDALLAEREILFAERRAADAAVDRLVSP
jgi:hypothetical protein